MKAQKISILTSTDFPYGLAAENTVRQIALGLKYLNKLEKVILFRGQQKKQNNDLDISCDYILFKKRPKNELIKFLEIFLLFIFSPIYIIKLKLKSNTKYLLVYGIDYPYYLIPLIIFCKVFKIKIIRIVTDFYTKKSLCPFWWKIPKYNLYKLQFKYFDRFFNGILCFSNYLKNLMIINKVEEGKILVIPQFLDTKIKIPQTKIFTNNKIKIGYAGTLSESNGIYDLMIAFENILISYPNVELNLIGFIDSKMNFYLNNLSCSTRNKINVYGQLKWNEVLDILGKFDILINPRKSSHTAEAGFPTKLGEYFLTKRPVVATEVGDFKLYFENKIHLILVKPDKPDSLMEGIRFLIENPYAAIEIGIYGYKWAKDNLDYINNSRKLVEFLKKL
ncbi:MAG: glycosyltransferase [Candidatus Lokiarchaeota archaeon]|nr:glycosyltransferase [Candidatus Lokiarchaeota archaeon]